MTTVAWGINKTPLQFCLNTDKKNRCKMPKWPSVFRFPNTYGFSLNLVLLFSLSWVVFSMSRCWEMVLQKGCLLGKETGWRKREDIESGRGNIELESGSNKSLGQSNQVLMLPPLSVIGCWSPEKGMIMGKAAHMRQPWRSWHLEVAC